MLDWEERADSRKPLCRCEPFPRWGRKWKAPGISGLLSLVALKRSASLSEEHEQEHEAAECLVCKPELEQTAPQTGHFLCRQKFVSHSLLSGVAWVCSWQALWGTKTLWLSGVTGMLIKATKVSLAAWLGHSGFLQGSRLLPGPSALLGCLPASVHGSWWGHLFARFQKCVWPRDSKGRCGWRIQLSESCPSEGIKWALLTASPTFFPFVFS